VAAKNPLRADRSNLPGDAFLQRQHRRSVGRRDGRGASDCGGAAADRTGRRPLAVSTNRLRHAGYTAALIRHGILPQAEYALETAPSEGGGYQAFSKILALSPRPDAVFCFSDNVAIGVMEAATIMGFECRKTSRWSATPICRNRGC